MAQTLIINGNTYQNVPYTRAPIVNNPDPEVAADYGWYYDVSDATLDSGNKMLSGVIGYGANGVKYTGSILTKTASDLSASGATVTVPAGYYASQYTKSITNGSATVGNILSVNQATVTVSSGTVKLESNEQVTPTVTPGYISSGTQSNIAVRLVGIMTTKAADTYTPGISNQTIAANQYLLGAQTIQGDANLRAENIKQGISIFGVSGTLSSVSIAYDDDTHGLTIS